MGNGTVVSSNGYPSATNDQPRDLVLDIDGKPVVIGTLNFAGGDSCGVVARFDKDCKLTSGKRIGSLTDGLQTNMVDALTTPDNKLVVGYQTAKPDYSQSSGFLASLDVLNKVDWTKKVADPLPIIFISDLTQDPGTGNFNLAFTARVPGTLTEFSRTAEYSPKGAELNRQNLEEGTAADTWTWADYYYFAYAYRQGDGYATHARGCRRKLKIWFAQPSVYGNTDTEAYVSIPEALTKDTTVNLTYSDGVVGPATVTIPAGKKKVTVKVHVDGVSKIDTSTIGCTAAGNAAQATVYIYP